MAGLDARLGISLQESMQILDVKPPLKEDEVKRRYEHLFEVNDKTKGGTLYLQAKVNFILFWNKIFADLSRQRATGCRTGQIRKRKIGKGGK